MPDLGRGFDRLSGGGSDAVAVEGSVSLLVDDDAVRVVMHGSIGHHLHQDVRDLVDDLLSGAAATTGRPVLVLMRDVRELGLQGVWLLLELRRTARPATVSIIDPSSAVLEALDLHGLTSFDVAREGAEDFATDRTGRS